MTQEDEPGPFIFRLNENGTGPDLLYQVCVERGWREYDCNSLKDNNNWNLWWRTSGFPVKDQLTRYLKSMKKIFGTIYNFSPEAYNLPLEYTKLVAECSRQARNSTYENPDNVWICKPVGQSQGRGILLFQRLSELVYESNAVVQQYVKNPLLIGGYKFDLRLYVCVPSFHPLTIFVYREGLARFGTDKFSLANLDNPFAHLTNSSLNKLGPGYGTTKERVGSGCKWSLSQLRQYLYQNNIQDWLLWQRISSIIVLTIASELSAIPQTKNCFEFFGFDILVDSSLNPWLLEVNLSPALANDCEVDPAVKKPMLHDMFDLLGLPVCNTGLSLFTLWTSLAQRHYTTEENKLSHEDNELYSYKKTANNVNRRTVVSASLAARRWRLVKTNTSSEFSKAKQEVIHTSRKLKYENFQYGSLSNLNLLFDERKPLFHNTARTFRSSKQSNKWGNGKDWSKIEPNEGNWTRIYPYTYPDQTDNVDSDKALRNIAFNVAKFNKLSKEIFRKNEKQCDDELNFLLQTSLGMKTEVWCPPM
ncbi:hypothetical protein M8J75_001411 [Diaphorina citri]|nr:hypothetical protein M8J75_001411 [Diaphorina citri]